MLRCFWFTLYLLCINVPRIFMQNSSHSPSPRTFFTLPRWALPTLPWWRRRFTIPTFPTHPTWLRLRTFPTFPTFPTMPRLPCHQWVPWWPRCKKLNRNSNNNNNRNENSSHSTIVIIRTRFRMRMTPTPLPRCQSHDDCLNEPSRPGCVNSANCSSVDDPLPTGIIIFVIVFGLLLFLCIICATIYCRKKRIRARPTANHGHVLPVLSPSVREPEITRRGLDTPNWILQRGIHQQQRNNNRFSPHYAEYLPNDEPSSNTPHDDDPPSYHSLSISRSPSAPQLGDPPFHYSLGTGRSSSGHQDDGPPSYHSLNMGRSPSAPQLDDPPSYDSLVNGLSPNPSQNDGPSSHHSLLSTGPSPNPPQDDAPPSYDSLVSGPSPNPPQNDAPPNHLLNIGQSPSGPQDH